MRLVLCGLLIVFYCSKICAQTSHPGIIMGNVVDEKTRGLEGATIQLINATDSGFLRSVISDKDGAFEIGQIPFGYYRLRVSYTGMKQLVIDSLHFRAERFDFNLNDVILKPNSSEQLEEVIIYLEKPLIQSKDGNITFNAG